MKNSTTGFCARILLACAIMLSAMMSALAPPVALTLGIVAGITALAPAPAQAGALSDYLENKLVDHVFRGTAYTAPATIYVALYTSSCSDSAAGTEVSGGSYARASLATGTTTWKNTQDSGTGASTGTSGTTKNASAVTFATPTAGWGTVTYIGLTDASTSGNLLVCSALTVSKTINTGDAVSFPIDSLTVQFDN